MNHFLSFVFCHRGEISTYVLVRNILNNFGIPAGNDKLATFMRLLCREQWIYVKTKKQWHKGKKGHSRSYGLGAKTVELFKEATSANNTTTHTPLPSSIYLLSPQENRDG